MERLKRRIADYEMKLQGTWVELEDLGGVPLGTVRGELVRRPTASPEQEQGGDKQPEKKKEDKTVAVVPRAGPMTRQGSMGPPPVPGKGKGRVKGKARK